MGNLALVQTAIGSLGNQHPRENLRAVATIGALNSEVILVCDGCSSFGLDLRGTFNLTIEVSGTINGTDWTPIPILPINQAGRSYLVTIAGSTTGAWEGKASPYWKIRARCNAFTSGAASVVISASNATLDDSFRNMTSNIVTILGAVSTAATLTLAAPGAGLRHYITQIRIDRFSAALLTAAATPIAVATTNIPGALQFTVAQDAAPVGAVSVLQLDYRYPLPTSAQNVATTIVAPLAANVIWRITAGFFLAP